MALGGNSGVTLIPALFSLGMSPLLLFQGVCPVCNLCSLKIAHWRTALILGSSRELVIGVMGLV